MPPAWLIRSMLAISIWLTGISRGTSTSRRDSFSVTIAARVIRLSPRPPATAASVLLLRQAPMTPLETRSEVLRRGARVGAIETSLLAEGKLIAKGNASFVTPVAVEGAPEAAPRPYDPSALPKWISRRHFDHKTFFDAQDIRDDGNGANWARMIRPLVSFAAPLASVFAVADSATVFPLVAQNIPAPWTFPNIDIGIHLSRLPCGDWVGMEPVSDWRSEGMGFTETRLYDTEGWIGRACQTVVLTPRS